MNKLHTLSVLAMFGIASSALAQTPPPRSTPQDPAPSTSRTEGTAADRTPPGETATPGAPDRARPTAGQQSMPLPSTSPAEGTAADRTAPGQTPTQTHQDSTNQSRTTGESAAPATSPTEGTAADRTAPGTRSQTGSAMDPEIVGLQVVSPANAQLGTVVDVVFDSKGQPDFVVIASEGNNAAVPYSTASAMVEGDRVIMDQSRLQAAPKVEQDEWRNDSDSGWKDDASRYWDQG